jgi:hypothetical protein
MTGSGAPVTGLPGSSVCAHFPLIGVTKDGRRDAPVYIPGRVIRQPGAAIRIWWSAKAEETGPRDPSAFVDVTRRLPAWTAIEGAIDLLEIALAIPRP